MLIYSDFIDLKKKITEFLIQSWFLDNRKGNAFAF